MWVMCARVTVQKRDRIHGGNEQTSNSDRPVITSGITSGAGKTMPETQDAPIEARVSGSAPECENVPSTVAMLAADETHPDSSPRQHPFSPELLKPAHHNHLVENPDQTVTNRIR